jgi:CTP synthase
MKYIVVTGGVISSIGKGITSSSIGLILKSFGYTITAIKIDPYLNIDAGLMSPGEHGECYVLEDGGETDLDLGNYERFLDINLTKDHNITTGKIYNNVISKERHGKYLGKTVQIMPHLTNEIQSWIDYASKLPINNKTPDFCIIEIGGTIPDMENAPFVEAIRQMSLNQEHQFCFIHVSLIIDNHELKTKPTQQSVASLRTLGIIPNLLILRTPYALHNDLLNKLSIQCHIPQSNIISNINVKNIYYVPHNFIQQKVMDKIFYHFRMNNVPMPNFTSYYSILNHFNKNKPILNIAIAGKYMNMTDAYLSIIRALDHASFLLGVGINIKWLNTEEPIVIKDIHAVIIPGGFGVRGIRGKLEVARICRKYKIPMLGICLGMQVMICELLQDNMIEAESTEWNPNTPNPVIHILPNQNQVYGGTMRLGNYATYIHNNTKTLSIYNNNNNIVERHRHRYEFNNTYTETLNKFGMTISGINKEHNLAEIVEITDHPFYIGCQFHPEYSSKNNYPHPLFVGLLRACL